MGRLDGWMDGWMYRRTKTRRRDGISKSSPFHLRGSHLSASGTFSLPFPVPLSLKNMFLKEEGRKLTNLSKIPLLSLVLTIHTRKYIPGGTPFESEGKKPFESFLPLFPATSIAVPKKASTTGVCGIFSLGKHWETAIQLGT